MRSHTPLWIRGLLAFAASLVVMPAWSQLEITITSGVDQRFPIAVVPFGWSGPGSAAPFDVAAVVDQDLDRSGYFEVLARRNMVSQPTLPTELNLTDWQIVDVDVVLFGRVVQDGADAFTIEFHLHDVIRGGELLGFRIQTNTDDFRRTAHRIADMVYETMTGIPGIFNTRIAYVTEEGQSVTDRRFSLIVADADGANANEIVRSNQPLMSPSWSPDGRQIAYVAFEGPQANIYVQATSTGTRRIVSQRAGNNQSPAWSPDGRMLALTLSSDDGNFDVYTLDLSNQVLSRITTNAAIDTEAVWSRDGRDLYFMSDRAGAPQIYRVSAEPGNRAERVTIEGRSNSRPRLSPDGSQLAMIHRDNQGRDRIAVLDLDSRFLTVLSDGGNDESPSFAPNGAMIIYATKVGGSGELATVSTDGRIKQAIDSAAGDVREPDWSPLLRP